MVRLVKMLIALATVLVVLGAEVVHAEFIGKYSVTQEPRFAWVLVFVALILLATYAFGVTERVAAEGSRFLRAAAAVGSAALFLSFVQLVANSEVLPRFVLLLTFVVLTPALTLLGAWADQVRERGLDQERVIALVGAEESERLRREVRRAPERPARVVALVEPAAALPRDGDPAPLERLVAEHRATLLVLDRAAQSLDEVVAQAARLHARGTRIRTLSLFYDEWLGRLPISELERIALLFDIHEIHHPVYARVKRILDVAIALVCFIPFLLTIPVVALLNLFGNRGSLFYSQERVGKSGAVFTIHKFRTMLDGEGPTSWTTVDDPRLTKLGKVLRKTHLDELPQVWNVLARDLSVVGPRPEQVHYVEQLREKIPFYDTRHLVRPGITGWAQVKYDYGSNELDALEKLQYEFFYLRHQSLSIDLRIIGRTLRSVVLRSGR